MKYAIVYKLYYTNRDKVNKITIRNCKDEDHCKERFLIWAKKKFKNAKNIIIKEINLVPDVDSNSTKEDIFTAFNDILGLGKENFKGYE